MAVNVCLRSTIQLQFDRKQMLNRVNDRRSGVVCYLTLKFGSAAGAEPTRARRRPRRPPGAGRARRPVRWRDPSLEV